MCVVRRWVINPQPMAYSTISSIFWPNSKEAACFACCRIYSISILTYIFCSSDSLLYRRNQEKNTQHRTERKKMRDDSNQFRPLPQLSNFQGRQYHRPDCWRKPIQLYQYSGWWKRRKRCGERRDQRPNRRLVAKELCARARIPKLNYSETIL